MLFWVNLLGIGLHSHPHGAKGVASATPKPPLIEVSKTFIIPISFVVNNKGLSKSMHEIERERERENAHGLAGFTLGSK
jgi:hypothetical protein